MPGRMCTLAALILLLLPAAGSARTAGHYVFDATRTEVHFTYTLPLSTGRGHFTDVSGSANIEDEALQRTSVEVTIGTRSLHADTRTAQRELRGKDFFSVATHPRMHFKSRRVREIGPGRAEMTGDISIRGITRPIVLHVTLDPPAASGVRRMRGKTRIRRSDFDMTAYPFLVADTVEIEIDATLLPAP